MNPMFKEAGGVIPPYSEYWGAPKQMFRLIGRKIPKNTEIALERVEDEGVNPRDDVLKIYS